MASRLKQGIGRLRARRRALVRKRRELRARRRAAADRQRFNLIRWFGFRRTTGFALLAAFLALRVFDPPVLENLRLRSFDFYQVLKPRVAVQRPVVILDIDEASLKALGQWPWPRTLLADIVTRLRAAGAAAIAFDIILSEPDRMSPNLIASALPQADAQTRDKLMSLPSNDAILADAIRGGKVVLGQSAILMPTPQPSDLPRTGIATIGGDPSRFLISFRGMLHNLPELEKAAAGRGVLTLRPERDGIVRRVPMVLKAGERIVPAMTLDLLRTVSNAGAVLIRTDAAGIRAVAVPGLLLPTDENGQLWINYTGHDKRRYVSAKDLLAGKVPPDRFAGRLVLIGTSAVGLLDIKATPVETAMPGVEVHAQVLENALTGSLLSRPNYATGVELVTAAVIGIAFVAVAPMIGATLLLALGLSVAWVMSALSWYSYAQQGLLFDLTFPLIAIFVTYMTLVFINYFREQKDRRRIRHAFGQYISPALVEQLAASPNRLMLGGEVRNMTVLFSDVRGFTTISERYKDDPQGLTQLMNRLLTPLTNAIIERNGTIDKYIGDAIMAFWNAPLDDAAHELNACAAALDMLRRIDELNIEREAEALEGGRDFFPIQIGLGINTGTCVVGNMGSDLRFDYSVLGDAVNLASRLEGRSKTYGMPIILGAATAAKAEARFAVLPIDLITVKGKTVPEAVSALIGDEAMARSPEFAALRAAMQRLLDSFRAGDWNAAEAALAQLRTIGESFELTELLDIYAQRIAAFRVTPPPEDWNGAFVFDSK